MLISENLVDVTIACEGASLKAHKMILSACSPFFQSLFMTNPCKHPIVICKDIRFIDLKAIIDFMYTGEVNVGQEQLPSLLKAAETLKVKGLAEVTEKQARSQSTFSGSPLYSKPKRRRARGESSKTKDSSCQTSESEDDSGVKRFHASRLGTQREKERQLLNQQKLQQAEALANQQQQQQQQEHELEQDEDEREKIDDRNAIHQEQLTSDAIHCDASRILEQSIATASVVIDNGADNLIVASDVHDVAEAALKQVTLFEEDIHQISQEDSGQFTLSTPQTSSATPSSNISHQGRRLMMSDSHKSVLKDYLGKPISAFDVIIDDWKKSIVWQYFGGLVYKNPETGSVSVVDNERHYCLKCIIECQEKNPDEIFERCNICFLSTGTATGNHKNHLRHRHQVSDEPITTAPSTSKSSSSSKQPANKMSRKRATKVISISLDSFT